MKYEPIRASVSPETIGKLTRLFNGSLSDILNELLQNARRAGASVVNVTTTPQKNAPPLPGTWWQPNTAK